VTINGIIREWPVNGNGKLLCPVSPGPGVPKRGIPIILGPVATVSLGLNLVTHCSHHYCRFLAKLVGRLLLFIHAMRLPQARSATFCVRVVQSMARRTLSQFVQSYVRDNDDQRAGEDQGGPPVLN
jgi:hypothetical protein